MKRLLALAFILLHAISAHGQGLLPYVEGGFTNNGGAPLNAGKICTTPSGTNSGTLPTYPTYADALARTNANANPVVLDSAGRANIWLPSGAAYRIRIIANGSGGTACNGTSTGIGVDIKIVDGVTSGITVINAITINGVQMCDVYPGSNASAKIAACISALPSTGGIADANGLQGAQVFTSDPFSTVTKRVTVLMSAATYAFNIDVTVPDNIQLVLNQGAVFSVGPANTLTIAGSLDGSSTSFHFSGSGVTSFTSTQIPSIYAEWFGALGDNGTTTNDTPFAKTFASIPTTGGSRSVKLAGGIYKTVLNTAIGNGKSNITFDMNGAEILFQPAAVVAGSDRALSIHTGDSNLSPTPLLITGPIAVGATSFNCTTAGDCNSLASGDWVLIQETDTGVSNEIVLFQYAQVASSGAGAATIYGNFHTAFPASGGGRSLGFLKVTDLSQNIFVRNGRLRTTSASAIVGLSVGVARGVFIENMVSAPANGNAFFAYRTSELHMIGNRQSINLTQASEIGAVDGFTMSGMTLATDNNQPSTSCLTLDYGTTRFSLSDNDLVGCGDIAVQLFAVHDGSIMGNTVAYVYNAGIVNTQGVSGLGNQRVILMGNIFRGGAGTSTGIAFADSTTLATNIATQGNVIGFNVVSNFSNPYGTQDADDNYIAPNSTANGSVQIAGKTLLGETTTPENILNITSGTQSNLPILIKRTGVNSWYVGPDYSDGTRFTVAFNAENAPMWQIDQNGYEYRKPIAAATILAYAAADGVSAYCSDCAVTGPADNTCNGGGNGAAAWRINGVWRCFNLQNVP